MVKYSKSSKFYIMEHYSEIALQFVDVVVVTFLRRVAAIKFKLS